MTEATVSPYVVRLIMTLQAHSAEEAVAMFVEELTARGARNWVYGVLDPQTGKTVAELNGYSEDASELIDRLQAEDDEQAEASTPRVSESATPDSDEELVKLAENLNAGQ